MKFLCIGCDTVMDFTERELPGDGTFAAVFSCPRCAREVAMLANPMETQLVASLGVRIGGRTLSEQPMELVREHLAGGREDAFAEPAPATPGTVRWSDDARDRLANVPGFVRGMVKRIYSEYAAERGIAVITPEVMDRARSDLGLEGM